MHMSQSLFNLTSALHVSGVTITNLQGHKTTVLLKLYVNHSVHYNQQSAKINYQNAYD
jgi:hypothetical protein